jgi:hypothetical protein
MDRSNMESNPPQRSRSARSNGGNSRPKKPPVDTYPLCQGLVIALKNDYGFICQLDPVAPEHIFFHASESASERLELYDAVQFRRGPSLKDPTQRTVAYRVEKLEGSGVVTPLGPDLFQGRVESNGKIHVLTNTLKNETNEQDLDTTVENETNEEVTMNEDDEKKKKKVIYVRYSPPEAGDESTAISNLPKGQSRLQVGDIVQFRIVYDHRTILALQQQPNHKKGELQHFASELLYVRKSQSLRIAEGVTGIVTRIPQSDRNKKHGQIQWMKSLTSEDAAVVMVDLDLEDCPQYAWRGGNGVWIQPGDLVLFDVVQDEVDGSCRAVPTLHLLPKDHSNTSDSAPAVKAAIRLLQLSGAGRAEGVVSALKDSFGFIQYADRPVDVHFKLYQLLPDAIQEDLRRYQGLPSDSKFSLEVGTQVQFDLSVHGTIPTRGASSSTSRTSNAAERENLKAQRICLLPPHTFALTTTIGTDVAGTITQQDSTQPYCGTVQLDELPTLSSSAQLRYPLAVQMIGRYVQQLNENREMPPLVYPDVQSAKDDMVVIELVKSIGKGKLTYSYIPQADAPNYPGRLVIQKATVVKEESAGISDGTESASNDAGTDSAKTPDGKRRTLRYDRKSHAEDMEDLPRLEDRVECDVVLGRRTGMFQIANLRKVASPEATSATPSVTETSVLGTIKELTPHFGLIALTDKTNGNNNNNNEVLYFSMTPEYKGTGSDAYKFRKGDLVRCDIGTSTNGQRVALNIVANNKSRGGGNPPSQILGLVLLEPNKRQKTPQNKSLRKATSGSSQTSDSAKKSRWDSVEEDRQKTAAQATEESLTDLGVILVTADPNGLLSLKDKNDTAERSGYSSEEADRTASPSKKTDAKSSATATDAPVQSSATGVGEHVRYRTSSLATHQPGAMMTQFSATLTPHRGDLVSFVQSSQRGIREVRVVTRGAATLRKGRIHWQEDMASAQFICDEDEATYDVSITDMISCDPSLIKDQDRVEGILHEGKMYGIARVTDLYIESKYATIGQSKERPKLNLTVKKDLGGTIVAQSMMAKGPDGTKGFVPGWTTRKSRFAKVDAPEFTPMMTLSTATIPVTPIDNAATEL